VISPHPFEKFGRKRKVILEKGGELRKKIKKLKKKLKKNTLLITIIIHIILYMGE